jgi:hypothetical protein
MMDLIVRAIWDGEAGVWTADCVDVPGLILEHPDLDELIEALADLGPDLVAANTKFDPKAVRFKLVAERLVAATP